MDKLNYWIAMYFPGNWMAWASVYIPIIVSWVL
jgi:hypothetical protein